MIRFSIRHRHFHISALLAIIGLLLQACSGRVDPAPAPQIPTPSPAIAGPDREHTPLSNLIAFARLYGYIRYFHPSDQAASTSWNEAVENGIAAVLDAKDPGDLATRLQEFFQPVAPTLLVFLEGEQPSVPGFTDPSNGRSAIQVVMWRHHGVSGDMEYDFGLYHSQRIREPVLEEVIPDGFPDPMQPFYAELGSGLGAYLPLALYADESGTLPHIEYPDKRFIDRPERHEKKITWLSAVIVGWNVLQHYYPYFDVVQVDWQQALEEALQGILEAEDEAAFVETLSRMVAQLQDGHARIGSERSYLEGFQPDVLLSWIEGKLVVIGAGNVAGNSLKPGDIILSIDEIPAAQAIKAKEDLISGATPQWIHYRAAQEILSGPAWSSVIVEAVGADDVVHEVSLTRNLLPVELEMLRLEPRPDLITEIEPGITYVDLNGMTDGDLTRALPQLEAASGIVFDMRGYPRTFKPLEHLIDDPVTSAQWYVPLNTFPDRINMTFEFSNWEVEPEEPRLTENVVFLIDGRAISAAETFLGIVEHYHLGELAGEPTAGTNGNINLINLPGGYSMVWTGMKVLKHDGSQHHGIGIQPTEIVSRTIQGIRAGQDEQLERAVEILKLNR